MIRITVLIFIVLLPFVVSGCSDLGDPVDSDGGDGGGNGSVSFAANVQPIFNASCLSVGVPCHQGATPEGNMNLEAGVSYGQIARVVTSGYAPGVRVVPGDPDSSVLFQKILGNIQFGPRMPFNQPALSPGAIEIIRVWIEQGAQND